MRRLKNNVDMLIENRYLHIFMLESYKMSTTRCRQSFLHHYRFSIQSNSFCQHSCFVDFNEILPSSPQLLISAAGANSQKVELKSCVLCSQECPWSGDCSHPAPVLNYQLSVPYHRRLELETAARVPQFDPRYCDE